MQTIKNCLKQWWTFRFFFIVCLYFFSQKSSMRSWCEKWHTEVKNSYIYACSKNTKGKWIHMYLVLTSKQSLWTISRRSYIKHVMISFSLLLDSFRHIVYLNHYAFYHLLTIITEDPSIARTWLHLRSLLITAASNIFLVFPAFPHLRFDFSPISSFCSARICE